MSGFLKEVLVRDCFGESMKKKKLNDRRSPFSSGYCTESPPSSPQFERKEKELPDFTYLWEKFSAKHVKSWSHLNLFISQPQGQKEPLTSFRSGETELNPERYLLPKLWSDDEEPDEIYDRYDSSSTYPNTSTNDCQYQDSNDETLIPPLGIDLDTFVPSLCQDSEESDQYPSCADYFRELFKIDDIDFNEIDLEGLAKQADESMRFVFKEQVSLPLRIKYMNLDHAYLPKDCDSKIGSQEINSFEDVEDDILEEKVDDQDETWSPLATVSKKRRGRPPNKSKSKVQKEIVQGKRFRASKAGEEPCAKKAKRDQHNEKERERRQELKESLDVLCEEVPEDCLERVNCAASKIKEESVEVLEKQFAEKILEYAKSLLQNPDELEELISRYTSKKGPSKGIIILAATDYLNTLRNDICNVKKNVSRLIKSGHKHKLNKGKAGGANVFRTNLH